MNWRYGGRVSNHTAKYEMEGVRQAIEERDWSEWDIIRVPDHNNEDEKLWAAKRK